MNQFITQLTTGALLAFALLTTAQARPDTVELYDENDQNPQTIDTFYTNYGPGYSGLVANIATAWNAGEGGVIDEFERGGLYTSFQGQPFISGYGNAGYYNPSNMVSSGPTIQLDVTNYDWDLGTNGPIASPAISQDYFMIFGSDSQNQKVFMSTSNGSNITQLAFTISRENPGIVTALAHFSGGTSYIEAIDVITTGNTFFGAVAPDGEYIDYFSVGAVNTSSLFIDDLAFRTTTPVPETSCISLAIIGLALAGRRRRPA
jgi:hypothetical protein